MRIIFAPTVNANQVAYLQVLIQNHHEKFKELYPDCSITPKMHYMIHMPRIILRYMYIMNHCLEDSITSHLDNSLPCLIPLFIAMFDINILNKSLGP